MADWKKLTTKQRKFIDEYVISANATQAALKAGYSPKTAKQIGCENLSKLDLYIQQRLEKMEDKKIAKAEEVLQYLTRVMRGDEKETSVVYDESAKEPVEIEKTPSLHARTKAAELLGKRYALFTERNEVSGSIEVNSPYKELTTEELRKLAGAIV